MQPAECIELIILSFLYKKYEESRKTGRVRDICFVVHLCLFRRVGLRVPGYAWGILNVCYNYRQGAQFKSRLVSVIFQSV